MDSLSYQIDITVDSQIIMDLVKLTISPVANVTKLRMVLGPLKSALSVDRRLPSFKTHGLSYLLERSRRRQHRLYLEIVNASRIFSTFDKAERRERRHIPKFSL